MENNPNQNYSIWEDPRSFFKNLLKDDHKYLQESAEKWAEKLTYDLSKQIIQFNFLFVAFVTTLQDEFTNKNLLYISIILSIFSIIWAFWYLNLICNENIKSMNKRNDIVEKSLEKINKWEDPLLVLPAHNVEMSYAMWLLRWKEVFLRILQRAVILWFIGSLIVGVVWMLG